MGNIIWFDTAGIVPCTPTAGAEQADSPASRMGIIGGQFERPWRAPDTSAQSLSFPFGSSKSIVAFALYNCNAPTITINGVLYTVSVDFDGMGKLFKAVPFSASTVAVSIAGSQATLDGSAFYKIGRLYFLTGVNEIEQNPESITREIHDPQITVDSELGVHDTLPAGSQYSTEAWSGRWLNDYLPNVKNLMRRRGHEWMGIFRNFLDRDYELIFYGKTGGVRLTYNGISVTIDAIFRQKC